MQSNHKEIYKLTAQRTGKSEQLYKDIGSTVFAELLKNLKKPKSLIIKLKGVGYWYLRKTRIQQKIDYYDKYIESGSIPSEERTEFINNLKERMKEYEEYSELRQKVQRC